jgi:hypothetical protein
VTFAPPTLRDLMAYYVSQGGVNLGIVGDTAHLEKGTSYHLGKDDLASTAYSIRTARDKAGLSYAASAVDLGRLDGTLTNLWAFSRWFAQQCMDREPGYRDVREVIFWSPIRERVIGWSDLAPTQWINDYGDLSHKTHTHISFYRDSEFRDKRPLFTPYFPEVDLPTFKAYATPKLVTVPANGWIYVRSDLSADPLNVQLSTARDLPVSGVLSDGTLIVGYRDTTPTETVVPTYYFQGTAKDYPAPPAADCSAVEAQLAAQTANLAAETARANAAESRVANAKTALGCS